MSTWAQHGIDKVQLAIFQQKVCSAKFCDLPFGKDGRKTYIYSLRRRWGTSGYGAEASITCVSTKAHNPFLDSFFQCTAVGQVPAEQQKIAT